ncbi:MAG: tetratricopeptide repeat protein [Fibrobacterales bacterium]
MMKNMLIQSLVIVSLFVASSFAIGPVYSPHKYQQNDWFGEFGETNAMYVNPASIAENDQLEISFAMFRTISFEAGQEYLGMAFPVDYKHSMGVGIWDNGACVDDGSKCYGERSLMFGYAYRLLHSFAIGANLSLLQINQFDVRKEITAGLDLGLSWNPINNSKLGFLQIGLALQNAFQPAVSTESGDSGYKFFFPDRFFGIGGNTSKAYYIPSNINTSFFYRGFNRRLEAKMELSFIDAFFMEDEGQKSEINERLETSFTATYYLSNHIGARLRFTKEGYPVIGGTVNVKDVNFAKYIELDLEVSHDDIIDSKNRGFLMNVKVSGRFGPTREEYIGEDRYRRLKIEPEQDYRRAMRLYLERKFLEAAYAFGKVVTKYPAFHLVDQAAFYKGKSFENMRMHKAARATYEEAIKTYPASDQIPKYTYQLMNIDYKEGKYSRALIGYQKITQKFADTDIKADADYIAGQIKFLQAQYDESISLLSPIIPGNTNYFYARYTMGISFSRKGLWEEAAGCFQDIVNSEPDNQSERDIQDAAKVKLGHIHHDADPPRMAEAFALYKQIERNSHVYDEAILAISWAAMKIGKYENGLNGAEFIINQMQDSYLVSESYLLKGYYHFIKKQWEEARKALEECVNRSKKPLVSDQERNEATRKYSDMIGEFEEVQIKAVDLARQLPTPRVKQKRAKLRPEFDKANEGIDKHFQFLQLVEQSNRFDTNRKRVLDDAEYTLALVMSRLGSTGESFGDELEELD